MEQPENFLDGLDKIMSNVDSYNDVSFKKAIFKLHEDILDKERNFVPINKEQINFVLRVIMFPLVFLVGIATSISFILSSTLYGGIMYKTGQNFLKPRNKTTGKC